MDEGAWLGYSPWGRKESDSTERLSTQTEETITFRWINNKVLQYPVIKDDGKEYKKRMYVCV